MQAVGKIETCCPFNGCAYGLSVLANPQPKDSARSSGCGIRPQTRQQSGVVSRHRAEVAGRDLLQSFDHPASTTFLLRTECGPSVRDGGNNEWDALFEDVQLGTNDVQLSNAAEASPHFFGAFAPIVRLIRMRQPQRSEERRVGK